MAIYEIKADRIEEIAATTFAVAGVRERSDLQRLLRRQIDIISPDTLVVGEEFGEWEESRRRIDILGLDKEANLVVIELKRTEDGGHMELQAIRYASMVSTMTFDLVVDVFGRYLHNIGRDDDPRSAILEFLEWDEPDEDQFAQDVRLVLVSGDFSRELTTSVIWLNEKDLDIRCVRIKPYKDNGRVLIDVQQVIPLPEAADYQVRAKEKKQKQRKKGGADFTRFDVTIGGQVHRDMWKRNAILTVVKHLCQNGVDPDRITELLDWRRTRTWRTVENEVDSDTFIALAGGAAEAKGRTFKPRKWHCRDGDLINANGKTFALSNQWGGHGWRRAMDRLTTAFPEFGISYEPNE